MVDTFSKTERSRIMSRVKSKNNKSTELGFISIIKEKNITGWRRNYPLTGKPDFVFPKQRVAIFIDGCFWHKCPKHCRMPSSNKEYWNQKIEKNRIRDRKTKKLLKEAGWFVVRIWEHEIKQKKINRKLNFLNDHIHKSSE